jgi:hypothetical protein
MWHLLRKGYPVEKPARGAALLWAQLKAFNIPHEFTFVGLIILAVGALAFFRKRRDEVVAYIAGIVVFLLVIVGIFNTPDEFIFLTEEFFTPLYLFSAVLIGLGQFYLIKEGVAGIPAKRQRSVAVWALVGIVVFALPVTVCALHYVENDQHENYVAYDYATNSMRSLPQGTVLYTWGDSGAFPLWYLQGVEKMREDVDLLHTPHLVFKWYLDAFPHLFSKSVLRTIPLETEAPDTVLKLAISEMLDHRPVFADFSTRYSIKLDGYGLLQRGICYKIDRNVASQSPPDLSVWNLYTLRGMSGDMFFRDLDTIKAILIYANSHMEAGATLLNLGRGGEGLAELRVAEKIAPELHNQIAQILRSYGM